MNKRILHLFLCVFFSSVSHAASPVADGIHFCLPIDPEVLVRDGQYAASKQALNLNAGEPRTVRMIYFLPNDRAFNQEVVDSMKVMIRQVQAFYAEQIKTYGYGEKTFRYEADAQGDPVVHRVDGQRPESAYGYGFMLNEIGGIFDLNSNIYLAFIDNSTGILDNAFGRGSGTGKSNGYTLVSRIFLELWSHELGHAFGLLHNFNDDRYIMGYGGTKREKFSELSAGHLAVHPHINPDSPLEEEQAPTSKLMSSRSYLTGTTSVPIQLEVSDADGLQQVTLFVTTQAPHFSAGSYEVKVGQVLGGVQNAVVNFAYDGTIPSNDLMSFSNTLTHRFYVEAVDMDGNVGTMGFALLDQSTHKLIIPLDRTFDNGISSVGLSPDGTILASGLVGGNIILWDTETGEEIATLNGRNYRFGDRVGAVAFSPDGTLLASGLWRGKVTLWDVPARTRIDTFVHGSGSGRVNGLSFSPDGTLLATGMGDDWSTPPEHTVKLWDVETRTHIATLEGHTRAVQSVAFSPDGKMLASGGFDSKVKLWDVATQNS